jgi:hypothetical protein
MQISSITGWQDHVAGGRKYLKTANKGLSRPSVFNNELIFQLAAMAIEKLIVGVAQYHRQMPADHTLTGLVAELEPVCRLDSGLVERIRTIESADDMCTLSVRHRKAPDNEAIKEILAIGDAVAHFVDEHIPRLDNESA